MKIPAFLIFGLLCCGCFQKEPKTDTFQISLQSHYDSLMYSKNLAASELIIPFPLDKQLWASFTKKANQTINNSLKTTKITYKPRIDTFDRDMHFAQHFYSDSLLLWVNYTLALKHPYTRYSFSIKCFKYSSSLESYKTFDKVATTFLTLEDGFDKQPTYIFRINNHLFWFTVANLLSGKPYKELCHHLDSLFSSYHIDRLENHSISKFTEKLEFNELFGSWKVKSIIPIFIGEDINSKLKHLDTTITFTARSVAINNYAFHIESVRSISLPSAISFLNASSTWPINYKPLDPSIIKFQGRFTRFKFHTNMVYTKGLHNTTFIYFEDKTFGFLHDNAFYRLERIK